MILQSVVPKLPSANSDSCLTAAATLTVRRAVTAFLMAHRRGWNRKVSACTLSLSPRLNELTRSTVNPESDPLRRQAFIGRAANVSPRNRFQRIIEVVPDEDVPHEDDVVHPRQSDERRKIATQFFADASRTLIRQNHSPDIPFRYSLNPYRGCEHGCAYCYARPSHETLGLSAGLDFETKILVKQDAPRLLRDELNQPKWSGAEITLSGVTDCYQRAEQHFRLTRRLVEILNEAQQAFSIITKNALVTRDLDLLARAATQNRVHVFISMTTMRPELGRLMEPRTSAPTAKLRAIRQLADAGVPVGVMMAPLIPGLNDEEIPQVLAAVRQAGAASATFTLLRLPLAVEPIFLNWLQANLPHQASRVEARLRDCRDGALNDSRFGLRMRGSGRYAEQIRAMFQLFARREQLDRKLSDLRTDLFRPPRAAHGQGRLF